jgi:hypothetical protein
MERMVRMERTVRTEERVGSGFFMLDRARAL